MRCPDFRKYTYATNIWKWMESYAWIKTGKTDACEGAGCFGAQKAIISRQIKEGETLALEATAQELGVSSWFSSRWVLKKTPFLRGGGFAIDHNPKTQYSANYTFICKSTYEFISSQINGKTNSSTNYGTNDKPPRFLFSCSL